MLGIDARCGRLYDESLHSNTKTYLLEAEVASPEEIHRLMDWVQKFANFYFRSGFRDREYYAALLSRVGRSEVLGPACSAK
jgi:hypothetical protein